MKNIKISGIVSGFIALIACLVIISCDESVDFKEIRILEMKIGTSYTFITPSDLSTGYYVSFNGSMSDGTLVFAQDTSVDTTAISNIYFHRDAKKILIGHCYFIIRSVKVDRISLEFVSYENGSMPKKQEVKSEVEGEELPKPIKEKQTL